MINYLAGRSLYLSGPIENGTDENWRERPIKVFTEEFGLNVYDPFSDPKQQWVEPLNEARKTEDYELMETIARRFVKKDLALVDRADIVVAYLPYKVATYGTCHEIINSNNNKKPTILVCAEGKKFVPLWFRGFIPHKVTFGSWEDCFAYLREVNQGLHMDNDRWSFVYGLI